MKKVIASEIQVMIFPVTIPEISNDLRMKVTMRAIFLSRKLSLEERVSIQKEKEIMEELEKMKRQKKNNGGVG